MKAVIQRVLHASVSANKKQIAVIDKGLLILLGIAKDDTDHTVKTLAKKIVNLRIMADKNGKMNVSVKEVGGSILVVSQFTLFADMSKGNRPSFIKAALPEHAKPLYELFIDQLQKNGITRVEKGSFGNYMEVTLVNDGPVTVVY